jgi:hypothetical protein
MYYYLASYGTWEINFLGQRKGAGKENERKGKEKRLAIR